jgi:hypothetical protein
MSSFNMGERSEGDDIAGFVDKVGSNVTEFHPGNRIAAFHIPNTTSFEEAAAIPLAAMTAAVGPYICLGLYLNHLRRRRNSCHLLFMELHLLLARMLCN